MSPDELRALAEALRPMAAAPCFDGIDLDRAADFLLACAEEKPVAWMHDGLVSTNKERVEHDEMRNRSCGFKPKPIIPLYAAPPAGPRRDPLRDALKTVIYELAALIPNPDKTLVDDWPCENAADRQCLQIAYTTAREALHGIGGSDER